MAVALIETDGAGTLLGVWVEGRSPHPPEFAFLKASGRATAASEREHAFAVVATGLVTWRDFLLALHERQNLITVHRLRTQTDLSAPELLAQVQDLWSLWHS